MKKILVPTDFSDFSENASEFAIDLAAKSGAAVDFLHILNTPVEWIELPKGKEDNYPDTKKAIGHANSKLHDLVKKARSKGLVSESHLAYDVSGDSIIKHLTDYDHDFIVMGSYGSSGMKEMLIGSNAQKVVRRSPEPVLVIKGSPKVDDIKNIVFASDLSEEITSCFLKVHALATALDARIHILVVNIPSRFEETEDSEKRIARFLKKIPEGDYTTAIWNSLYEERGIITYAEHIDADAIAMITHGKTGLRRMIYPSITEAVSNHSEIPILSIRLDL